jgi:hypothetical protein
MEQNTSSEADSLSGGEEIFCLVETPERRGRVFSTPASYLGSGGFRYRPGDRLSY